MMRLVLARGSAVVPRSWPYSMAVQAKNQLLPRDVLDQLGAAFSDLREA